MKLNQQECEKAIEQWLGAFKEMRKLHPNLHPTLDEFILDNGRAYNVRGKLPKFAVVTPKSRECYFNAWKLRGKLKAKGRTLRYAEGYAMHSNFIIPVLHGWLVDENDQVLDTSIELDGACAYYGVTFRHAATDAVWTKLRAKGLIGILGNAWQLRLHTDDLKELTNGKDEYLRAVSQSA